MIRWAVTLLMCIAPSLGAAQAVEAAPRDMTRADIVFMGEVHDNPDHHVRQAQWVADLAPKALVFEMLTPEQAGRYIAGGSRAELEAAFDWANAGWPDFAMYYPIFAAAPDALVFGAGVPRAQTRDVAAKGLVGAFGESAEALGLTQDLPEADQKAREAMQMAAHCDALPETMLPMMVDIQRLRDGVLARAAAEAFGQTGGPVAVITGNGHARRDWGAPEMVARLLPDAKLFSAGQGEVGPEGPSDPQGVFDLVVFGPRPERGDPCAAFN